MGSAAGWDGISYLFLNKYWDLIGEILTKAANKGIREGEFSTNFRTGLIRIIPKKGDCKRIEDWRPITLLSCSYKVVSGVVAMRIESVILKLIGRGQKGFIKGKNIHMCNLNLIENISMAWVQQEELGILCIDFNKAFDSVEHYVIMKVFEFFNFRQIMCKIIGTLLRNRVGRVILTDGFSKDFKIERGTPQGDRSSPNIFILCIKILLLKLEQISSREGISGI
jgi:Reverse transcriptase (RNA-dependent DNA polymerase)